MNDLAIAKKPPVDQAAAQGPLRHRRQPVRRPRRVDQHHAPHPAGDRLRGDPPRPQPLGRTRSSPARCRKTRTASPSRRTRAATSSSSSTCSTCCASAAVRNIKVFGGGGGVIVADEIDELHAYGVTRIFSPEDGARLGLAGHDQRDRHRVRYRSRAGLAQGPDGAQGRRPARARALHHRPRGRGSVPAKLRDELLARGRGVQGAGARHYRHRRRG